MHTFSRTCIHITKALNEHLPLATQSDMHHSSCIPRKPRKASNVLEVRTTGSAQIDLDLAQPCKLSSNIFTVSLRSEFPPLPDRSDPSSSLHSLKVLSTSAACHSSLPVYGSIEIMVWLQAPRSPSTSVMEACLQPFWPCLFLPPVLLHGR